MAETLLIGVDGSKCCNRAVKCAAERAKASGARLIVAFVIEWSRYTFNTPEENEERHKRREQEIEVARTRILDPLVDSLKADGLNVEGVVRHGHVAEVLCDLAKEYGVSQIYIGRIGQSKIRTLLFGSVAGSLVQISPVPVTVVP